MRIASKKNKEKSDIAILNLLDASVRKNEPYYKLIWLILGGKNFSSTIPSTLIDYVRATEEGLPKLSVINIAHILDVPMKAIAVVLNLSYKTLSRKGTTDSLNSSVSSHSIEIANIIAKGMSVFEDPDKFNRWLQKENKALGNKKPFDLLNTPTGIRLIGQVLGRIEEGVYT